MWGSTVCGCTWDASDQHSTMALRPACQAPKLHTNARAAGYQLAHCQLPSTGSRSYWLPKLKSGQHTTIHSTSAEDYTWLQLQPLVWLPDAGACHMNWSASAWPPGPNQLAMSEQVGSALCTCPHEYTLLSAHPGAYHLLWCWPYASMGGGITWLSPALWQWLLRLGPLLKSNCSCVATVVLLHTTSLGPTWAQQASHPHVWEPTTCERASRTLLKQPG
jgi:hypothetical protein